MVEDHSEAPLPSQAALVKNFLGAISLLAPLAGADPGPVVPLASGADFYAAPRLAPDGGSLAWVEWDHPSMPWDETSLCTAAIVKSGGSSGSGADRVGLLEAKQLVAGGPGRRQAVMAPAWSEADGKLYFVSDATGWWNIWSVDLDSGKEARERCQKLYAAEVAYSLHTAVGGG